MKVVITYGTFDLFHVGHVRLLKRLSKLGDKLIVGISSDSFNELKGKESFFSYKERAEIVKSCRFVDEVFPENNWEQKEQDIVKYGANIFAMGNDWHGKFDHLNEVCDVVYLKRTEHVSTTEIKKKLSATSIKDIEKMEQKIHDLLSMVKIISKV
ncbi:glycerol-3-phosphate cytidylyltransferase [Pseudoalteromonas citrea]|uniref:Glycerol-3-phosphate cytidylyltransferase n=1 Tax=Pseudoalteromonas citrea TaxID=43655 RepID=A0A5S3XQD0_9GAMM|nr:adenylyltransferase/cytidyltransferase family protein [Pseudoalteromonas citrea]TMP45721.1 glycerol-3-phosphate cytidylyltransferase [Pseudoalteromonas citrea]TMP59100.1 glycerol-3-phosphate cytidylyltransferase [Pseudoalteromonas citrea]